jgi:hypothetical protein
MSRGYGKVQLFVLQACQVRKDNNEPLPRELWGSEEHGWRRRPYSEWWIDLYTLAELWRIRPTRTDGKTGRGRYIGGPPNAVVESIRRAIHTLADDGVVEALVDSYTRRPLRSRRWTGYARWEGQLRRSVLHVRLPLTPEQQAIVDEWNQLREAEWKKDIAKLRGLEEKIKGG